MEKVRLEIVDRPTPGPTTSEPVSPEGLQAALLETANTTKAVRFTVSDLTFRLLHNRLYGFCQRNGLKLKYTKVRPKHRSHREKDDPYDVIMWADTIPASESHTQETAEVWTSSNSETPEGESNITDGPTTSEDDDT